MPRILAPDEMWSATEAANYLGIRLSTLYAHNHYGTGPRPCTMPNGRLGYIPSEVRSFKKRKESEPRGWYAKRNQR